MGLDAFDQLRGRPPKITHEPTTARITKIDTDGMWVVPIGGDLTVPVGPCPLVDGLAVNDLCLLVFTQERPWAYAPTAQGGVLPDGRLPDRLRELPATIVDWNEATRSGFYRVEGPAANQPPGGHFGYVAEVLALAVDYVVQNAYALMDETPDPSSVRVHYRRVLQFGMWSAWERVDQHTAADVTSGTFAIARLPVAFSGTLSSTTVVRADDSRLYDARTPTAHSHAAGDTTSGTFAIARLPVAASGTLSSTTVVRADDSRLSNARTPTAHTHAQADVTGLAAALATLTARLDILERPGVMIHWGGGPAPAGYLLCDGSAVSRTTYAALFAQIGTTYGAGDGSSTFNLPDARDRKLLGASGARARGTTGGADTATLAAANLPANISLTAGVTASGGSGENGGLSVTQGPTGGRFAHPVTTNGTATPVPVMDPYLAVNVLIKT
ncbi:tail fiber protein [Nocardioides sp. WV_118_6]